MVSIEVKEPSKEYLTKGAISITEKDPERFEKINKVNNDFVVRYCHHTKELIGTARDKAREYFNRGLIHYNYEEKCFYVEPLPSCRITHKIVKRKVGFECSCQKCQEKIKKGEYSPDLQERVPCSHIAGLYLWFKLNHLKEK